MGPSTSRRDDGPGCVARGAMDGADGAGEAGAVGDDDGEDDGEDVRGRRRWRHGGDDNDGGSSGATTTTTTTTTMTKARSQSFDLTTGRRKSGDGASTLSQSSRTTTPEPFELSRPTSPPPTVLSKLQKWGDYQSLGTAVRGSRLVPMKTPLAGKYFQAQKTTFALTVSTMLEAQRAIGKPIGMIVDLSNHDCLYDGEVPDDVERVHVRNVAKSVPSARDVKKALDAITRFTATDDRYVAIHCAYGFNRTGFIVCCYLIEVCGLTPEEALGRFADARAPGLKHQNFKDALYARYMDAPDSPEITRLTAQLFRVSSSLPDMLAMQNASDDNETLDLEINRKFHWHSLDERRRGDESEDEDANSGFSPSPARSSAGKPPKSPLSCLSPK
jgi:atypical dual specificity phosphatase